MVIFITSLNLNNVVNNSKNSILSEAAGNKSIESELNLINQLKNKESIGLEILYQKYANAMFGSIIKIVKSSDVAEEVLQDVFFKVWNKIDQYDPAKSKLFTWIYRISTNLAIDKIRSKEMRNSQRTDSLDPNCCDDHKLSTFELKVDQIGLKDNIQKLASKHLKVIDLIYYQGYTHAEIAEEFNIPLGTVKTRARAGMNSLRKLILN